MSIRIDREALFRVLIVLVGQISIILAIAGGIPWITGLLGVVYGLVFPAWILRKRLAPAFPALPGNVIALILCPIFVPIWMAIFSILWLLYRDINQSEIAFCICIMIMLVTSNLVLKNIPRIHLRGFGIGQPWLFLALGFLVGCFLSIGEGRIFPESALLGAAAKGDTEFYFLPATEGIYATIPGEGDLIQPKAVVGIRVINRESEPGVYRILISRDGKQAIFETSPFYLENNAIWEDSFELNLPEESAQKIIFYLERGGSSWPYRTLDVWLPAY